ncbi:MAG: hypothetical protein IKL76_04145 [Clostridia bacterium]|nr:hypothetical protein [Clostridia bacterium]
MSKNKYFIPFDLLYEIATPSTTVRNDNIPYAVQTRRYEQFKARIRLPLKRGDTNSYRAPLKRGDTSSSRRLEGAC